MKTLKILVPTTNHNTDYWSNFINKSIGDSHRVDHLIVDFNTVAFLNTDDLVMLACLIEVFYIQGAVISFQGGIGGLNSHLDNIRFREYWRNDFDRESFTASKNSTTLCLWKISPKMIYDYSSYAKNYFMNKFLNGKDLISLSSNLDEVFNNIFDHAQSKVSGYIMTQYFPNLNKLSFSVCDFGIGIPNCINQFRKNNLESGLTDGKALEAAMKLGFSVKSIPQNRGLGLNNVVDFIDNSNGELLVISNYGCLNKKANQAFEIFETESFFPGTMIKVEVDTTTFEMMDDDEVFDF